MPSNPDRRVRHLFDVPRGIAVVAVILACIAIAPAVSPWLYAVAGVLWGGLIAGISRPFRALTQELAR